MEFASIFYSVSEEAHSLAGPHIFKIVLHKIAQSLRTCQLASAVFVVSGRHLISRQNGRGLDISDQFNQSEKPDSEFGIKTTRIELHYTGPG